MVPRKEMRRTGYISVQKKSSQENLLEHSSSLGKCWSLQLNGLINVIKFLYCADTMQLISENKASKLPPSSDLDQSIDSNLF